LRLVNGLIVYMLRLPPLYRDAWHLEHFGALNIYYSHSETIRQQDVEAAAPFLHSPAPSLSLRCSSEPFGLTVPFLKGSVITYGSILMVLLAVLIWYMLNRTAFGGMSTRRVMIRTRRALPASAPTGR